MILFAMILTVVVGAWTWILLLVKKGPRALLGHEQVVIHQFENSIVYRNGVFERVLPPGGHWLSLKNCLLIRVDMRPEILQIIQGTVTSDRSPVILRCIARIQIRDPKFAIEAAQDYRHEAVARLQSVVKTVGNQLSFRDLQLHLDEFNAAAQKQATLSIAEVGCECIGFELLQVESGTSLAVFEDKQIGFGPH